MEATSTGETSTIEVFSESEGQIIITEMGTGYSTSTDYDFISSMLLLGVFLIILLITLRRLFGRRSV